MSGGLRAAWRLLRGVVHVLHGVAIALNGFDSLGAAEREARIRWWATKMLRMMGVELRVEGAVHEGGTLLVANHVSWLDIMAVHAVIPQARFVSKADVRSWPVLSRLVAAGGTLYLERERKRDALRVVHLMAKALAAGQTVAVFPEGTTSDGRGLLPFHANLLQAAISTGTPVQPVALRYSDAHAATSAAVEFVGETTLVQSLWQVARGEDVVVHVTLAAPRSSTDAERRALAQLLRDDIAARLAV
jgi:1-acyl-sn-glycerol-3-phosphate acyltransferase